MRYTREQEAQGRKIILAIIILQGLVVAVNLAFLIVARGILIVPPFLVIAGIGSYVYFALYDRRAWARWFLVITSIGWPVCAYARGRGITLMGLVSDLIAVSVACALIFPIGVRAFFSKEQYAESTTGSRTPIPTDEL